MKILARQGPDHVIPDFRDTVDAMPNHLRSEVRAGVGSGYGNVSLQVLLRVPRFAKLVERRTDVVLERQRFTAENDYDRYREVLIKLVEDAANTLILVG